MTHKLFELCCAAGEPRGCLFLDAATVAETFATDSVPLDVANTRAIGAAIADLLNKTGLL